MKGSVFLKSVYKFVFPLLLGIFLCFGCITVAHAFNEVDSVFYNGSGFEIGDTIVYYCRNQYSDGGFVEVYVRDDQTVFQEGYDEYMCFYLEENASTNGGYSMKSYGVVSFTEAYYNSSLENTFVNNAIGYGGQDVPWEYMGNGESCTSTVAFFTNIPIFSDKATADAYHNGADVCSQAINYNKEYSDGSWVKPFEDIEINDSDIVVPQLSSLSHNGFTIDNLSDNYFVEIYMTSGLQDVYSYLSGSNSIDNSMYFNNYGLISNNTEEALCQKEYDIAMKFGIDNHSVLTDFSNQFYNTYPKPNSIESFGNYKGKELYPIWGVPFGLDFNSVAFFFTDVTPYLNNLNIDKMPLAYSNYRVRFYYYNDSDGMHYGPWADYVYFSDGRVSNSAIFQSDTGNIITTPIQNGSQDDTGNINVNTGSNIDISDFDNPNELFGYLRSIINNISATSNSFTALFSAFFTVIPSEIQATMWLSIALMCFGSLILWVWRK